MKLTVDGRSYEVEIQPDQVVVDGAPYKITVLRDNGETTVKVAGRPYKVKLADEDETAIVDGRKHKVAVSGRAVVARKQKVAEAAPKAAEKGAVHALMPGKVLSVRVQEGQQVAAGAVLLILEAMKMENEIKAPKAGTVKRVSVAPGQTVNNGDILAVVE